MWKHIGKFQLKGIQQKTEIFQLRDFGPIVTKEHIKLAIIDVIALRDALERCQVQLGECQNEVRRFQRAQLPLKKE